MSAMSGLATQLPLVMASWQAYEEGQGADERPTLPVGDVNPAEHVNIPIVIFGNYHPASEGQQISTPFGDRRFLLLSDPRGGEIVAAVLVSSIENITLNLMFSDLRPSDNVRSFPVRLQVRGVNHPRLPIALRNRAQVMGLPVADKIAVFRNPSDPSANPYEGEFIVQALLFALTAILALVLLFTTIGKFRARNRRATAVINRPEPFDHAHDRAIFEEPDFGGYEENETRLDHASDSKQDRAPKLNELNWHEASKSAPTPPTRRGAKTPGQTKLPLTPEQEVDRIIRKAFGRRAADRKSKRNSAQ